MGCQEINLCVFCCCRYLVFFCVLFFSCSSFFSSSPVCFFRGHFCCLSFFSLALALLLLLSCSCPPFPFLSSFSFSSCLPLPCIWWWDVTRISWCMRGVVPRCDRNNFVSFVQDLQYWVSKTIRMFKPAAGSIYRVCREFNLCALFLVEGRGPTASYSIFSAPYVSISGPSWLPGSKYPEQTVLFKIGIGS